MRLPQITYSQAAQSNTISPGQAAAPHIAKVKLTQQIGQMALNVNEMKNEYDVNNNAADYNEAMGAVDTILTDRKDNYTAAELESAGISHLVEADDNGEAESWRVYPHLLAKTQEDLIEQLGGNIKSSSHRKAWADTMRDSWRGVREASVQKAATMAVADMKNEQIRRYEEAIAAGRPDEAIQALDVSFFGSTPALERERTKLERAARESKALSKLSMIAETGTAAEMQSEADSITKQLEESETGLISIGGAEVSRTTALKSLGQLNRAEGAKKAEEIKFEEESYWSILRSEDPEQIASLREDISGDGYEGGMDEFKRVQWQTRIDSTLGTGKAKLSIDAKVQVNDIMDRLDAGAKGLKLGDDMDTTVLEKDIETLEALPKGALSDSEKVKIKQFRIAQKEYAKSAQFRAQSLPVQAAVIAELKNTTKRTPAQELKLSRLEQINASKRTLLEEDSVVYAQEYRGAEVHPLVPGADSFTDEAANRVAVHKGNIEENGTSTGPLSQAELTDVAANMDADPAYFLGYIGAVHEAVGGDTRFYLEQLKEVASPSAIVAAEFMTMDGEGGQRDAQIINRGTQVRADKQYPIFQPSKVTGNLRARLQKMYPNDRARAEELTEAALDYYVGLQTSPAMLKKVTDGEYSAEEISDGSYEVNTDVLDVAVNSVTGGESTISPDKWLSDNYNIPSPVRGMDSDATQSWFDGLRRADMPEIRRGVIGGGKERMAEMIADGDIKLVQVPEERGKYYAVDVDSGIRVPAPDGRAAVLVYK